MDRFKLVRQDAGTARLALGFVAKMCNYF